MYDGAAGPGKTSARWDGRNERGQQVASGQYFYRLESGGHEETRALVLYAVGQGGAGSKEPSLETAMDGERLRFPDFGHRGSNDRGVCSFSSVGAECIDYRDYLHWAGSVDTPGGASGVAIALYAYVAAGSSGLQVIDITNPQSPQIVGSVDTPGGAREAAVSGTYAYVADYDSGLQVIDITNPQSPQIVGSVDTPFAANDVAISGAYAYVANGVGHPL